MTSVPGVDHPEELSEADVTPVLRGITVSSLVESVQGDLIAVRPSVTEYVDQVVVKDGDVVEVFWSGPGHHRALTAEVLEVEQGPIVRWRLRITSKAEQSQRRKAVRARVTVPVLARSGGVDLVGETIDLSEAGMRAMLDGWGLPPEPGQRMEVTLDLGDGSVSTKAEVVRHQSRGARWLTSIKFVDIIEKDQDHVRRRVFQALREERLRDAD
jgi:c-di-GMP-binding flagellar brake protein YcgR